MAAVEQSLPESELEVNQGLAQAEQYELERVRDGMRREQEWLKNERRYMTNADVLAAALLGELVRVEATDDYRPIRTFLEPKNLHKYHPFLKPGAVEVLDTIGERYRQRLERLRLGYEIRLPVTSMTRSMERQAELTGLPGKLVLPPRESGHSTGWDFDLDSSSYYRREDGRWLSVSRRNPEKQQRLFQAKAKLLGAIATPSLVAKPETYDPRPRLELHRVIAELYAAGRLSPVVEYPNTPNEVIHVGVNPEPFQNER